MKPVLPEAALAQHIAVLGKTGSGKTFAVKGVVEALLSQRKRVGVVDPTGAWWGLRSSADGKEGGFPILVLGGDHGDLPLPALGGAAVARLLVEQGVNLVADTSQLHVGERTRWFIDFAYTLYRMNRGPLHLVMDEAHVFAPQGKVPDPDTGKMLHAANQLASGGRSRGIRLTMITQRPQKLHKDALTSADTLIAMRVLAPQDRLAVEEWIKGCGDMAQGKEVLNSLASLQRGEGWVWYPEGGFLKRLKFPTITTFDSSATPTDGRALKEPKGAAEIDLTEIKAALAEALKEAQANDPKLLRAEIARLRAEASRQQPPAIDTGALEQEYRRGHADGVEESRMRGETLRNAFDQVQSSVNALGAHFDHFHSGDAAPLRRYVPPARQRPAVTRPAIERQPSDGAVSPSVRKILDAIHSAFPVAMSFPAAAARAAISKRSSQYSSYERAVRSSVEVVEQGGKFRSAPGFSQPVTVVGDPVETWASRLPPSYAAMLRAIARSPRGLTKEEVAPLAGVSPTSSGLTAGLRELCDLALVEIEDGKYLLAEGMHA